jgi:hypothetical protein
MSSTPTRYFTVDRANGLQPGADLVADSDFAACRFFPIQDVFTRDDLESLARELFPGGLTKHGKRYLLDECLVIRTPQGPAPQVPHIPMIELASELVRRLSFPQLPSRLQALFAWASYDEALAFQRESGGSGTIYEVEADKYFRGDMRLLYLGGSGIGAWHYAMKYWRGEASPTPRWEYLLVPSVRVLRAV